MVGLGQDNPPVEVDGTRPQVVGRLRHAWLVESGGVDLFVTQMDQGTPVGARHHVLRVEEGGILCGIDLDVDSTRLGLIAIGLHGTRLRPTAWDELGSAARRDPGTRARLETWLADLARATTLELAPRRAARVTAGADLSLHAGEAAIVTDGVCWVQLHEGRWAYQGCADVCEVDVARGDRPCLVPLSRDAWLRASTTGTLRAVDLADLPEEDLDAALLRFHAVMACALLRKLKQAQEADRQRLLRKRMLDRQAFSRTLQGLAAAVGAARADQVETDADQDAFYRACATIGRVLHTEVRRPTRLDPAAGAQETINAIARTSELGVRPVVLAGEWWTTYSGPLLALVQEDRRPVALLPSRRGRYRMYDTHDGSVQPVTADLASRLIPHACSFYRPFPNRPITALDLARFGLLDCRRDVATLLLMGALGGLLTMITPVVTGVIFDDVIPGAMRPRLIGLCGALLLGALATGVFQVVRSFAVIRLETRMNLSVQAAVWDRVLRAPIPFFRDYNAGDLASRALGIDAIRQALTGSAISAILSGLFSLFGIVLLFYYSWRLAVPALVLVAIACGVTVAAGYRQVRYQRRLTHLQGRISGLVLQVIGGVAKLRVSGAERRAFAKWGTLFAGQKQLSTSARVIGNRLAVFNGGYPLLCTGFVFLLIYAFPQISLSTGSFLAFNAAFTQLLAAMLGLCTTVVSAANVVPYYERARPILTILPEVTHAKTDPGELSGAIEISHVTFRYRPDLPVVLHDVSISVQAGEFVAFVGPSGCGKSTLFRLLLGFEEPESGAIYYDGQKLSDLDVHALRRQIGVVLQNGKLVAGDIITNIVGASPHLTPDDAWEAARLAGLDQDIANMPMGLYTMVAEGGGGLSGGQRQRLLVARALVARPRILLFDEATSALDNQTQMTVSRSIDELRATRIVIAHRLTTVQHANRIYVMDKGRIVESGGFEELIRAGGHFAALARRQIA